MKMSFNTPWTVSSLSTLPQHCPDCFKTDRVSQKKRALLAFSRAKKWHFERPDLRTESKNLAKHPPKWLGRHLGHAFPFSGEYQAKF